MRITKHIWIYIFLLFVLASCASIPGSTGTLSKEVIQEADAMHQLNVSLVNQLFQEREQRINHFITYQYTPALLGNYEKLLPEGVDYKNELPAILQSLLPIINTKRDSLQGVLDGKHQEILKELNDTYASYNNSSTALQGLIDSAIKLKASETTALAAIENLTGVSPDKVTGAASTLEKLLKESGATAEKILQIENSLKQ